MPLHDFSNTKVAEIEDVTSIFTTSEEAITPRREKQIGNLTPRPIAISLDGGSNVSGKEQITPLNVMSKYLVQYVPAPQEKKKALETRATGLRVLTSSEGIAILKEKEERSQKKKEEKEKRKQERLKRKKQEELAKKSRRKREITLHSIEKC